MLVFLFYWEDLRFGICSVYVGVVILRLVEFKRRRFVCLEGLVIDLKEF